LQKASLPDSRLRYTAGWRSRSNCGWPTPGV
jgi:hypothetical protein